MIGVVYPTTQTSVSVSTEGQQGQQGQQGIVK